MIKVKKHTLITFVLFLYVTTMVVVFLIPNPDLSLLYKWSFGVLCYLILPFLWLSLKKKAQIKSEKEQQKELEKNK